MASKFMGNGSMGNGKSFLFGFATTAAANISEKEKKQDEIDKYYKEQVIKTNFEEAQKKAAEDLETQRAQRNAIALQQAAASDNSNNANTSTNTAVNAANITPAQGAITPQTPAIAGPTATAPVASAPQAAPQDTITPETAPIASTELPSAVSPAPEPTVAPSPTPAPTPTTEAPQETQVASNTTAPAPTPSPEPVINFQSAPQGSVPPTDELINSRAMQYMAKEKALSPGGARALAKRDLAKESLEEQSKRADIAANTFVPWFTDSKELKKEADNKNLPYYIDTKFNRLPAKKQEEEYQKESAKWDKTYGEDVSSIDNKLQPALKLLGLNDVVSTGYLMATPGMASVRTAMDSNYAEFQKYATQLVLQSRPKGYSRVTNFEVQMFQRAQPSLAIPNEANKDLLTGMIAQSTRDKQYYEFRDNWIRTYGRDNPGLIDQLWGKYNDANPIFMENKEYKPILNNKDEMQTWQDFFKNKSVDSILAGNYAPKQQEQPNSNEKQPDFSHLWNK